MTISSQTRKAGPFVGNGSSTSFPFAFKVFQAADLLVVRANSAGVETVLVLNSDYTVNLNANQNSNPGGTVVLGTALATGTSLVLTSQVQNLQPTDLTNQGGFYPRVVTDALDRATIQIQQLAEDVSRAAKLPITNTGDAEALTADLVRLAGSADNIDTVAASIADVSTAADNIAAILDAPAQAAAAASSASAAATSASSAASSAAAAASALDNFDDRYLGAKASDPAADNDGNALVAGALYYNTTTTRMRVYEGSGWIDASSASIATMRTYEFVATGGQTTFSGADAGGNTLSYLAPALIVTLNGVVLRPGDDYTATNGTSVVLTSAAALSDELVVVAFGNFVVANIDAQDVQFIQSGTGAAGRTAQAEMREDIKSTQFSTLQEAVTAAAGKRLRIIGAYSISAAVTVPAGTYIVAYGGEGSVTQTTGGQNAFTVSGDGVTIDGVTIIGPNTGSGSAVRADSRSFVTVKNCTVRSWLYGIQLRSCVNAKVLDNTIYGGTHDSVASSDIFVYGSAGAQSSRTLIRGNHCLSNNDCGISVDTNSGDKETIISGNIVYPMQADGLTPLADANNRRRYGIIVGYNGTTTSRAVVQGNVVRDIPYAGIYANTATLPGGDLAITGNHVARCGFGTLYPSDSSLRAGIWCNGGADSITGNVVTDCSSAGIKVAPSYTYSSTDQPRAVIGKNNVARTAGYGIWLTLKPHGYLVSGNRVVNSTNYGIYYETTSSDGGNCHFSGNHVDINAAGIGGIVVSNAAGGYPCFAQGNKVNGNDNTTNDQFNAGIWFDGVVHVAGNEIRRFHRGVNNATAVNTRNVTLKCSGNVVTDCAVGVSAGGTGTWLIVDNTFSGVTTECNGAAWQGVLLKASSTGGFGGGPVIRTADSAAPTAGTWAVGDHCAKTNVAAGQPKGWFCTVAGTPGTWVSEGNL